MVFNIMIFVSWNVLTCLAIELVIKVKKPLSTNYALRNKIYIIGTVIMTISEFSPMLYFQGFGLTTVDTCYVKDGQTSYWFALIPIFLNIPINFVCFFILKCSVGYNKNKALQKMVRACFSMCVCWGYPIFTAGMKTTMNMMIDPMNDAAFIVGSSSGTVLAVCRLGSIAIFKRLWTSTFQKSGKIEKGKTTKGIGTLLIQDCSVNFFFQELTEDTVRDMLLCLSMALLSNSKSKENYSYGYKKIKHKFQSEDFVNLEYFIEISSFMLKDNGIWEYEREHFKNIKAACGVSNQDIIEAFSLMTNFSYFKNNNTAGRSGAFIMVTFNERFVLKIVNRKERYLLLDILPAYTKRVCECPKSKIARILGMFKVTSSKHSFIIMENIIKAKEKALVFDLKGSMDDRYVQVEGTFSGAILKDGNFLEMHEKVCFDKQEKEEFLNILADDLKFFTKHNIIDYSLLIAIYSENINNESRYNMYGSNQKLYSLGIIDFLQEYSFEKKLELLVKRIKGKVNTSVCSSVKYSRRFLTFIGQEFLDDN